MKFFEILFEILKNKQNFTNYEYVFVTWFHNTLKNFAVDSTNIALNFYGKKYFQKLTKIQKKFKFM